MRQIPLCRRIGRSAARVSAVLLILVLLVSVATSGVGSVAGVVAPGHAGSQGVTGGDQPRLEATTVTERKTITLVTGDRVTVAVGQEDVVVVDPNGLEVVEKHGETYVYPDDIDRSRFDRGLFNVDLLVEEGLVDGQSDSIPVIVDESAEEYGTVGIAAAQTMDETVGVSRADTVSGLGATAARIDKGHASAALSAIERQYDVEKLYLDRTVEVTLDESVAAIEADEVQNEFGIDGEGVTVAVLDTGVDGEHPAIEESDEKRFTDTDTDDIDGHGTHVAGIVAGSDDTYTGVAPGADIMDVKVLGDDGSGYLSDVADGIDYAVKNGADVISMSIGSPDGGYDSILKEPIRNAIQKDVTVVVAAGNNGDGLYTITKPGSLEGPITVGATDYDFDGVASYSSRGPTVSSNFLKPDVVAPGSGITSADNNGGYVQYSGTSMATPHVAGVAALLIADDSTRGHDEIKEIIASRTDGITDETPLGHGTGQVNATKALTGDIVIDDPVHSFGVVETSAPVSRTIRLQNHGDQTRTLTLSAGLVRASNEEPYHEHATLNRTSVPIAPDERVPIQLNIDTLVAPKYYAGDLTVRSQDGTNVARASYAFIRRDFAVEVDGSIAHAGGTEANADTVLMKHDGKTSPAVNRTVSGAFSLGLINGTPDDEPGGRYELQYYQGNRSDPANRFARDGAVDLYAPRAVDASSNVDLGTITLPDGHVLNTTVVGPGGEAVENATLSYKHTSNDSQAAGTVTIDNSTDANGQFRQANGVAGLEVADNVTVTAVADPDLDASLFDNGAAETQQNVSADTDVELTLPGVQLNTTPDDPVVGQQVTVNASESVGAITSYQWTFGDGAANTTTAAKDTYSYSSPGTYTVTLNATNADGQTAVTTETVQVRAKPTVDITSIAEDAVYNRSSVDLDASTSNTVAEDIVEYELNETGTWQPLTDGTTLTRSDGTHNVTVRVRAEDGTVHATDTVNFTVDTTAPGFTGISVSETEERGGTEYANETVAVSFGTSNDDQDSLAAVRIALESRATNYRHRIAAKHDAGSWSGTIDLANVTDDGTYNLTLSAVDEAGNRNQTVVTDVVVDRAPPELAAAIEQTAADEATITVRSSEQLRSSTPAVNVSTPENGTKEVTVTATSNTREYDTTIDVYDSGTYAVAANGTDLAGNYGSDTAAANVTTALSTGTDNTAAVVNVDTGSFVEFTTDEPVSNTFVSLSESDTIYGTTTDEQVGLGSLTGRLGSALSTNLKNATIAISVANTTVPAGVAPENVSLRRYDTAADSWNSKQTSVKQLDRPALGVSGAYWVANVTQFSTYGAIATDQSAPTLTAASPASGQQLTGGTTRTDVSFSYDDAGTGINVSSVELEIDGTDLTDATRTNITSTETTYSGYPVAADEQYTATLTVTDRAGNQQQFSTTFSVPPAPSAGFSAGSNPTTGSAVTFDASSSDGAITSYQWAFGDGTTITTKSATTEHSYSSTGSYDVTLTVTDDGGQTATVTKTVDVESESSGGGSLSGPPLPGSGSGESDSSTNDDGDLDLTLDTQESVAAGGSLPITATVENGGSTRRIETVGVTVDGQSVASRRVSLAAGGAETVTATMSVPADAAGQTLSVTATAGTHSETAAVRVRGEGVKAASGSLAVEAIDFPETASPGGPSSVAVTLGNTGDQPVTEQLEYRIAGETVASRTVTLEPGASQTVTLAGTVPEDVDGSVTQTVQVGGQMKSAALTISDGSSGSDSIPGFGVLVAVLALLAAAGIRVLETRQQ